MIGGCCVDTLAYGGYSNDYPLDRWVKNGWRFCVAVDYFVCLLSDIARFILRKYLHSRHR